MRKKMQNPLQGGPKNFIIAIGIIAMAMFLLTTLTEYTTQSETITYSEFLRRVEAKQVKRVHLDGQEAVGIMNQEGKRFDVVLADTPKNIELLRANGVEVSVASPVSGIGLSGILLLGLMFIALFVLWYVFRQSRSGGNGGGGGNIFGMGKSLARMFMPSMIKEKFSSVAGADEAKEDLRELVDYLKNPEKFKRLGAKITRGVLLVGAPGNGKTLLAKAVAGEANCPFFSVSGSDFIEVFVGVGAARVRDLFARARKHSPSIIFIDEIDAVGRHRGSGMGGGHDEREQTLNQLLTEMDGFQTEEGSVIVIAATNRPDILDKALLRPGRFDRRIEVPYPDVEARKKILAVHAANVKMDPTISLDKIARGTPGFTGADLQNLINEAALAASTENCDQITLGHFERAHERLLLGKELKTKKLSDEDKKVTAIHEAGHALVRLMMPQDTDPLHKVTIIPRERALGVTVFLPEEEKYMESKEEMLAHIITAMGGRCAEELEFGKKMTGAGSDFQKATQIARRMVCQYGMSDELGPVVYTQEQGDYVYSQKIAERIDEEVQKILVDCQKRATELIAQNRDKLHTLSNALLEKETMTATEIYELLGIEPRHDHTFQ